MNIWSHEDSVPEASEAGLDSVMWHRNESMVLAQQFSVTHVLLGLFAGFVLAWAYWAYCRDTPSRKKGRLQKATDSWMFALNQKESAINKTLEMTERKLSKLEKKLGRATNTMRHAQTNISTKNTKINELQLILGQTKKSLRTTISEVNRLKKTNDSLKKEGCSKQELEWFQDKLKSAEDRVHKAETDLTKERKRAKGQTSRMQKEYAQVRAAVIHAEAEKEKRKESEKCTSELESQNKALQQKLGQMEEVQNTSKAAVLAKLKSQAIEYKALIEKLSTDMRKQVSEKQHYKNLSVKLKNDLGDLLRRSFTMLRDSRAKAAFYKRQLDDLQRVGADSPSLFDSIASNGSSHDSYNSGDGVSANSPAVQALMAGSNNFSASAKPFMVPDILSPSRSPPRAPTRGILDRTRSPSPKDSMTSPMQRTASYPGTAPAPHPTPIFRPNLTLDSTWLPGPNIDAFLKFPGVDAFLNDITEVDLQEPPRSGGPLSPIRRPGSPGIIGRPGTSQPDVFEAGRTETRSPSNVSFDPFSSYLYIGDRERRKSTGNRQTV